MVGMALGGSGGLVDDAVGVGVGIASVLTGGVPAMFRCLDPTALGLVLFDFNPAAISMTRSSSGNSRPNSKGGSSNYILSKSAPPTISLSKIIFTGETTKLRVDTLMAWCGPPAGLLTQIASMFTTVSSSPPDVTFQWGPPLIGFMYTVNFTSVTANYTRFHTSGIPIRADLTLKMTVKPSLFGSIPTNPTSGGLPGRSTHMMRSGESLQSIAHSYYGRPGLWRKIAEINGIDNPSRVRPGTTVFLPSAAELTSGS